MVRRRVTLVVLPQHLALAQMRYVTLTSLSLILVIGCDGSIPTPTEDAPKRRTVTSTRPKLSVALLGDDIRVSVAEHLASDASLEIVTPPRGSNAPHAASAAWTADVVILVTDATQGPLPVHREHSMILRQIGVESIGLLFANTKQLSGMPDAVELLELEELEVREVLNAYDLPGDTVTCLHDNKLAALDSAPQLVLGIPAILEWIKRQEPRSRQSPPSTTARLLEAETYLMSQQESAHSKPLANGSSVSIFVNGHVHQGTVGADLSVGSSSRVQLRFSEGVACEINDRFLILVGNHAVGAGAIIHLGS